MCFKPVTKSTIIANSRASRSNTQFRERRKTHRTFLFPRIDRIEKSRKFFRNLFNQIIPEISCISIRDETAFVNYIANYNIFVDLT